jgi:hypothetical protein
MDQETRERPDLIEVRAESEEDEAADKVDLYVDVEGSSLFTGRMALSKAREVHGLVESSGRRWNREEQRNRDRMG